MICNISIAFVYLLQKGASFHVELLQIFVDIFFVLIFPEEVLYQFK